MNRPKKAAVFANVVLVVLIAVGLGYYLYLHPPGSDSNSQNTPIERDSLEEAVSLTQEANYYRFGDGENITPNEVIRLYDQAIEVEPDYLAPRVYKAYYLVELSEYDEALSCFAELSVMAPESGDFYVYQALCMHQLGRDAEAAQCLRPALHAFEILAADQPFFARVSRATIYFIQGNDEAVEAELELLEEFVEQNTDYSREYALGIAETCERMEKLQDGDRWLIIDEGTEMEDARSMQEKLGSNAPNR